MRCACSKARTCTALGAMADLVNQRERRARQFIVNRYINYSNYCILSCQFCAFARKKRDGDGFEFTVDEIVAEGARSPAAGHYRIAHRRRTASLAALSATTRTCCGP